MKNLFTHAILLLSVLYAPLHAAAQLQPIGQWRSHLPYQNAIALAEAEDRIYCASVSGLFYVLKSDNSMHVITRIDGLSDVGVSSMAYNTETHSLVVAYANSNIDIIAGSSIRNIPDIKNTLITGTKNINHISFKGHFAYLSTDIGIVVLDLQKYEIKDTYKVSATVSDNVINDVALNDTMIFAATNKGLYAARLDNQFLNAAQSWTKLSFRPNATFNYMTVFNNRLYVNLHAGYDFDSIYSCKTNDWRYMASADKFLRQNLRTEHNKLVVTVRFCSLIFDTAEKITLVGNPYETIANSNANTRDAILDADQKTWLADATYGLMRYNGSFSVSYYIPNGPCSEQIFSVSSDANTVWYTTGGHDVSFNNVYNHKGISGLVDNQWTSITPRQTKIMDTAFDYMQIAIDPQNGKHIYLSTYSHGLLEFNNGNYVKSIIPNAIYSNNFPRTFGMAFDINSTLWFTNTYAIKGLSAYVPATGKTYSYTFDIIGNDFLGASVNNQYRSALAIDDNSQKWFILARNSAPAIGIYNDNGTMDNPADDAQDTLSIVVDYLGSRENATAQCLAKDHTGNMWIGTDKGVVVVYSPALIGNGTRRTAAQQVLIQQDGYNQYLLSTDVVSSIAIDGANRKWFGTEKGGVFLFSADGTKELLHFTTDNSPLPDNNISSIAVNNTTGEVFIGTGNGMVSYRADATAAGETSSSAYAYPNPVPSGYHGTIAIAGLATGSTVKITDVSGHLVFEAPANGGTASWDGNTMDGSRAETGVYLVFASDSQGQQTATTKILFVK